MEAHCGTLRRLHRKRDDYIGRLKADVACYRERIRSLEAGEMQFRERRPDGVWVEETPQWIEEDKRSLAIY
jgi:hypothetical protein